MANIEILVVAGGGGGGGSPHGGGAGGGGLIYKASHTISPGSYPVTVGAGGAGYQGTTSSPWPAPGTNKGTNGENSVFDTLTAIGGGGGGGYSGGGTNDTPGQDGGSGGGGTDESAAGSGTAGQGNDGGVSTNNDYSKGGGGAGEQGGTDGLGHGGDGLQYSISGTATYYAGGGGGAFWSATSSVSNTGGLGGGGNSGSSEVSPYNPGDGVPNTGGGGGGAERSTSGDAKGGEGGSGIVIISYATDGSDGIPASSTGGTVTTSGDQTIHTFTADGTFTVAEPALTVTTDEATNITTSSADVNGEVNSTGGNDVTERGFVYSTTSHADPGDISPATSSYEDVVNETGTFGAGIFSDTIADLPELATRYVRAYAKTIDGYAYGAEISFTTLEQKLEIQGITSLNATEIS